MSKIFISYGDDNFTKSLKRIGREAKSLNRFDKIILYTPKDLPDSIKSSPLFCFNKGGGYWLWKPYLIYKTLCSCEENDVVYYADAGCTLQKDSPEWEIFEKILAEYNAVFFQYQDIHYEGWEQFCSRPENNSPQIYHWMKPSVVEYFKEYTKGSEFMYLNKIWAGLIIIKKTSSVKIVSEWLNIMLFYPQLVTDPFGSDLNDPPTSFNVHRHDQTILTPLVSYYQKEDKLYVMPETSERQLAKAAVLATRKRDKRFRSSWEKMKYNVKQMIHRLCHK